MKGIIILTFTSLLTLLACNSETNTTKSSLEPVDSVETTITKTPVEIEIEDSNLKKLYQSKHPWLEYYSKRITDFNIIQFKFEGENTINMSEKMLAIGGSWKGDKDYDILGQLQSKSPDENQYIDLHSYGTIVIRDPDSDSISFELEEVDQEVSYGNIKIDSSYRIQFCGSACYFEEAHWFDNNNFVLMGKEITYDGEADKDIYSLFLCFYDLSNNKMSSYRVPDTLATQTHYFYTRDVKYKGLPIK